MAADRVVSFHFFFANRDGSQPELCHGCAAASFDFLFISYINMLIVVFITSRRFWLFHASLTEAPLCCTNWYWEISVHRGIFDHYSMIYFSSLFQFHWVVSHPIWSRSAHKNVFHCILYNDISRSWLFANKYLKWMARYFLVHCKMTKKLKVFYNCLPMERAICQIPFLQFCIEILFEK